jgi:hypothetical protein
MLQFVCEHRKPKPIGQMLAILVQCHVQYSQIGASRMHVSLGQRLLKCASETPVLSSFPQTQRTREMFGRNHHGTSRNASITLFFVTPNASVHHFSLPLLHLSRCGTKIGTFSFSNKSLEFRFENSTWLAMSYNIRVSKLPRSCREAKTNRRVHEPTRFCSSNRHMLCPQSQGWHSLSDFYPLMESDCSSAC